MKNEQFVEIIYDFNIKKIQLFNDGQSTILQSDRKSDLWLQMLPLIEQKPVGMFAVNPEKRYLAVYFDVQEKKEQEDETL